MELSEYHAGGIFRGQPSHDLPRFAPRSSPLSDKIKERRTRSPQLDGYTRLLTQKPLRHEFKLRFVNSPSPVMFTYYTIEAEDGCSLAVELVDGATDRRVTSGPISSSRVEIVALAASFNKKSWTVDDFNMNIVTRKGKRILVAGDLIVTLKNGFGVMENVVFTHDSSWCSGTKFRLGAKAIGGGVVEARSEAFECTYPLAFGIWQPSLWDEVWKLEGIPENGIEASLLAKHGIRTVKELRRGLAMNPDSLHRMLGRFVSKASLATTVSHAMRCNLDGAECYAYNVQATQAFLLFNSVYELIKLSFDGVRSLNYDQFTSQQKELIDHLKLEAYENVDKFTAVDISSFVDYEQGPDYPENSSKFSEKSEVLPPDTSGVSSHMYDVVIRYIEGNVTHGFISHLHDALCRKGISVAKDFVQASMQVQPANEVPECRVLIIFLTSSCISSNLLQILRHQLRNDLGVSRISYRLSPSDSTSNKNKLERFYLQNHRKLWDVLKETVPENILTDKSESELMHEIVRDVSNVLSSNDKEKVIGMETRVEEVLSLLCIESTDVRRIGIWATAGIGKTAIAETVFRRISVQYMTCVFLKDLHEQVEEKGQVTVIEEVLSKILEVEPPLLQIFNINTCFLRTRLQCKRVLVVLDDVNNFRDIETLMGHLNYLGPGSRIIITSRNRRVFVQCKIDSIYEVKPLDIFTSLLLLDFGTFRSEKSMSIADFRSQSLELLKFANGNPEVLQYIKRRFHREWTPDFLLIFPFCIPRLLRGCYGLDENEMNILLDIACFFNKMEKDTVAMLLDGCGFFADVGFRSLVDKSLLTTSHNLVNMQMFIQATGREIVRQESANWPGMRSRLWNHEDIVDAFLDVSGTSAIEGIFLDMSKKDFDASPTVFEKMRNLRLLKFYFSQVRKNRGVSLPQGLEFMPSKLRLLHWENYPLSSLPRSFDPKNLVELNLPSSCAKKLWKGKKSLEKLKRMKLSYSYQLTKIPTLSRAPNLEHIDLQGCNSLVCISQSICHLKKLVFLNLKGCSNLENAPSTTDLESLEVLNLSGCSKLEIFPETSPSVKELYLGGTMIQEIPSSIKNLVLLEKLDLEDIRHLKNLPTSICKLKHLETLNLSGCSSFERFPDLTRKMKCLKSLDLSRTAIKELRSSISYMIALEELRFVDCKNLVRLPDNIWSLRFKVEFRKIDTHKFSRLWNSFEWLSTRGPVLKLPLYKEYSEVLSGK